MISICTRWETSQMPPDLEWRMWSQIKGAFGIDKFIFTPIMPEMIGCNVITQFQTMEEALDNCYGNKVFLEPESENGLEVTKNINDIVYVLGNTEYSNINLMKNNDISARIKTKNPVDFYGINAAAITLAYKHGQ